MASGVSAAAAVAARTPGVTVTKLRDEKAKFILTHTDTSVANALRRVMMAEVPTFAIDQVEIVDNSSVMHDEFVAHRLGLVPLRWLPRDSLPQSVFNFMEDCDCDFSVSDVCPKCCISIHLDIANTAAPESNEIITVTSRNLVLADAQGQRYFEVAHFVSPEEEATCAADAGIAICKLGPGQALRCICTARMGVGKMHAKYNPTGTVSMRCEPEISLNSDLLERLTTAHKRDFVRETQPGIFRFDEATGQIVVVNAKKANNIDEIRKIGMKIAKLYASSENLVNVGFVPDRFIFTVEATGALTAEQIVMSALQILIDKMSMLQRECFKITGDAATA